MTHLLVDANNLFSLAGGIAVFTLGVLVLSVKPRAPPSLWFGLFALGMGSVFVVTRGAQTFHVSNETRWLAMIVPYLLAAVAMVRLASVFPRPIARSERGALVLAGVLTLTLAAIEVAVLVASEDYPPSLWVREFVRAFFLPTIYGFLVLIALRFHDARDAAFRHQLALTAVGLTLFAGFAGGYGSIFNGDESILHASGPLWTVAASRLVVLLLIAILWLRSTPRRGGSTARNMALFTLVAPLAGLLVAGWMRDLNGSGGAMRLLMTIVLTYAILKHQLLGIDVKVRFALSKSTIAAVFIAVFFIASETAQQFFGDTLGSTYIGIAAAGMLVFAMAPLQRVAERLAERAVPVTGHEVGATSRREETFRVTLRKFLADDRLTREEEGHLARLATHLGIDAERAHTLRDEEESARVALPADPGAAGRGRQGEPEEGA